MRKITTRITRWFRRGPWVAGFSTAAVWVVVCVALVSPLLGGDEPLTLKGHTDVAWNVAFSADGKRLASASNDQTVKAWDASSGQEMLTSAQTMGNACGFPSAPDQREQKSQNCPPTFPMHAPRRVTGYAPLKSVPRTITTLFASNFANTQRATSTSPE